MFAIYDKHTDKIYVFQDMEKGTQTPAIYINRDKEKAYRFCEILGDRYEVREI